MIRVRTLIRRILVPTRYLWINVILVRETPRAILVVFDGQKAWIPKSWLRRIKLKKSHSVIASPPKAGEAISIKISEYHWARKFA